MIPKRISEAFKALGRRNGGAVHRSISVRRLAYWAFLLAGAGMLVFVSASYAAAQPQPQVAVQPVPELAPPPDQGEATCLTCHSTSKLTLTLGSGQKLDLDMDQGRYLSSIHGDKLTCTDCHRGYTKAPHNTVFSATTRQYSTSQYEICKRCHFANYTKTLDSIHYKAIEANDPKAALCVDCHGSHYVTRAGESRAGISTTCAQCHPAVSKAYQSSAHGAALVKEGNQDVPVCTDCHGVHNIHDPRTASFRLNIPEMCGKCHTDEKLMAKYGLSTRVLQTYLQDFHGVTNEMLRQQSPAVYSKEAVCTDCHGIHDITRVDAAGSKVLQANLAKTCRECHTDATDNFPAAWLSHYEPSINRAPLVFLIDIFYKIFIPFMVGGILLHIMVDVWRMLSGRK